MAHTSRRMNTTRCVRRSTKSSRSDAPPRTLPGRSHVLLFAQSIACNIKYFIHHPHSIGTRQFTWRPSHPRSLSAQALRRGALRAVSLHRRGVHCGGRPPPPSQYEAKPHGIRWIRALRAYAHRPGGDEVHKCQSSRQGGGALQVLGRGLVRAA
jgi:hypothetical protein